MTIVMKFSFSSLNQRNQSCADTFQGIVLRPGTRHLKSSIQLCIPSNQESQGFSARNSTPPSTHHLALSSHAPTLLMSVALYKDTSHIRLIVHTTPTEWHSLTFAITLFPNNIQFTENLQGVGALTSFMFIIQPQVPHFKLYIHNLLFRLGN